MKGAAMMEEITQAAKAVRENFSEKEKRELEELFRKMDKNGDGKISFQEFMAYSKEEGSNPMVKPNIFNLVDQNGDGNLQLEEVYTLCYIIASGRPTCRCCGACITGLFFTCTDCRFNDKVEDKDNYDLCIPCYHRKEFKHDHTDFVDNYMLLSKMQLMLEQSKTQFMSLGSSEAESVERTLVSNLNKTFPEFSLQDVESNSERSSSSESSEGELATAAGESKATSFPPRNRSPGSNSKMAKVKKAFSAFGALVPVVTKLGNALSSLI